MTQQTTSTPCTVSASVSLIIQAAKGYKTWGRYAAQKFIATRGIDVRLVKLARQLEAIKGF